MNESYRVGPLLSAALCMHVILPTAATAESDEIMMKIIAQKNALSVSVQNIFGLGYSPLMRAQTEEHISESERR